MSANNYPLGEDVGRNSERITAFFSNQNDAYRALTELKQQGFSNDQIGVAALNSEASSTGTSGNAAIDSPDNASRRMRPDEGTGNLGRIDTNVSDPNNASSLRMRPDEGITTESRLDTNVSEPNAASLRMRPDETEGVHHEGSHRSFWQDIKGFFSGESQDEDTDFRTSTQGMNWSDDRYDYYSRGLNSGGAIVTVVGGDLTTARTILERCGGDLRESGFESFDTTQTATRRTATDEIGTRFGTNTSDYTDVENQRIQLRGELLRAHRERVQRGDVRLRKEVVTENQTIEVPVTREELVIERVQPTGTTASGQIGDNEEIRVPLSEERVVPEKQQVVNEEVRVGKREVTSTEKVSGDVRHEELRVEGDKDLVENPDVTPPRRKKPAA